jgi:(4S)-4-hydroxy-5-phosphonooxypentane-2,3-dione isomerase
MYTVHVHIHIKPDVIERFREATIENARNSLQEPGVLVFDFYQNSDDPTRFVLIEVYREPEDANRHKETAHYLMWRDTVTEMMAAPRVGTKFTKIYPPEND